MQEAEQAPARIMTVGEWEEHNHRIRWSIYDPESYAVHEAETALIPLDPDGFPTPEDEWRFRAAYHQIRLNLTAPPNAPDGVHEVFHQHLERGGRSRGNAAVITNGQFRLPETADAVLTAVCDSMNTTPDRLDHVFIERWSYEPDTGRLYVYMGS